MLDIRGRVVVYSVVGCPHCLAAKQSLKDAGVPYSDVSVERFPMVRQWLQSKTGKTSVPQIFFNETYIGGNDSLQNLMKDEEEWQKLLDDIQENEANEGELVIPDPSDAVETSQEEFKFVCEIDPISSIVEGLLDSGILHCHRVSLFSNVRNAFSGQQFVEWIMEANNIDEEESLRLGNELLSKKYINALEDSPDKTFVNDPEVHYSLLDNTESAALNGGPSQNCALNLASDLSETLRKLILQLYNEHISADGKVVNYKEMKETTAFEEYVKLSRELQRVAIEDLSENERKAFYINIYNALVIHATIENGPPSNWWARLKFFDRTTYIIGGHTFSLNDIENGILRGNKRGVAQLFAPFGRSDPRRSFSLSKVDARIHFALNCGARSCPPIKTFSAENIDEELRVAAEAYLEQDEALRLDEDKGIIYLSSLIRWYASDFGDTIEDIVPWILSTVAFPEKKEALERILIAGNWKVKYIAYDWSTNSAD